MKTMWLPLCSLWLLGATLLHWCSADDSIFCDRPANMELCYQRSSLEKRFLRFGRALTDDPFLRFGRNYMDKRFLRFGRSDVAPDSESMLRLALASSQADDLPLFQRKKRSTIPASQASPDSPASSSDHPDGVAKREVDNSLPTLEESKRFMRFGRGGRDEAEEKRFMRFGKRFMRFGRGDQYDSVDDDDSSSESKRFMRFGKRFMRFGKQPVEQEQAARSDQEDGELDKRFMRFGKRFMRFGRNGPVDRVESGDKSSGTVVKRFMRFGRDPVDTEQSFNSFMLNGDEDMEVASDKRFMRFGKRLVPFGRDQADTSVGSFSRFEQSGTEEETGGEHSEMRPFLGFGKRFMRFGRSEQDGGKSKDKRFMRFGKRFTRFGKYASQPARESKSVQSS